MPREFALLLVLSFTLLFAGCGPLLDATVSGRVTLDGKPLSQGTVSFHPLDKERNAPAAGEIDASGNYRLITQEFEGVLNGEYKVTVVGDASSEGGRNTVTPLHYGLVRQTPLRYKVKSGNNVININLELTDRRTKFPGRDLSSGE